MRSKLLLMFISICIAALGSAATFAQGIGDRNRAADSGGGNYSIQGRVYLPDGRPAQNVRVEIVNSDAPSTYFYTNTEGVFQTGSVRAGNNTISVTVPGFPTEREILTIERDTPSGRTFNVALYLRNQGQKKGDFYSNNPLFADVPKPAMDKFRKGMEKLEKNDAKAAVPLFDEAIAAHPNFAPAYFQKGSAHLKLNELDPALEAFVKAIGIKADYVEAKYSVGYTQYVKKNYVVAAAVFDDVLKQKSDMADAEMYRGLSLFHLKNVDAAEASLKKTIGMTGGDRLALAHLYLGQIYIQKKKNAEAAAELEKYLELVPKAPNAEKLKSTIADLKKQT